MEIEASASSFSSGKLASYSSLPVKMRWKAVTLGGGFFVLRSISRSKALSEETLTLAVAIRR